MVDAHGYITALLEKPEAAFEAVSGLAAIGLRLDEICVAMEPADALDEFCDKSKVIPLKAPIAEQLQELGISVERAAHCEESVLNGSVLLLLPVSPQTGECLQLLRDRGADAEAEREEDRIRIPLHAERLCINKRTVRENEVRVRKVIAMETHHAEVVLKREELVITRTEPGGRTQTMRIPLSHEEFDINRYTVVTNEAAIRRETHERVEHISEQLRRERLEVRKLDSSADPQTSTFASVQQGNSSVPIIEEARENGMQMHDTSTDVTAFFPDRMSADAAAEDLRSEGIADEQITVRDSQGAGFLEDIKRFFGGQSGDSQRDGAMLLVRDTDRSIIEPSIRRNGGQMENSTETGEDLSGGTMKLHEERLNVTKHAEKEGEVRLTKDVVTTRQEVDVPVKREEVVLTRHRVNEVDDGSEIGDREEVRIPVMRDEVEVQKEVVTTEEVGVEKRAVETTEHVSASLQKERARLETDGKVGTTLDERD